MTMSILPSVEAFLGRLGLGGGDEAAEAADLDREAFEARLEILIMLAREKGGRADDRDLHPGHRRDEGGAERDLGLAEADVADDQPIHRLAGAEIAERVGDGAVLIVGFLVREAVDEAGEAGFGFGDVGLAQRALGGDGDELARDFADPLLHPRLAALPRFAAELVEAGALFAAVAGEDLEVFDRDVELVAAEVGQRDAIVRVLADRDRGQALVAADAVFHVDDKVAGRQRSEFGEEGVGGLLALVAADQPVAEHVLFGQDRDIGGGEAVVERQDDRARHDLGTPRCRALPARCRRASDP